DPLKALFVALQDVLHRLHRLGEAALRLIEELLARLAQELAADLMELRGKAVLRLLQRRDLLFEGAFPLLLGGPQRRKLLHGAAIRVAFLGHLIELKAQVLDRLLRPGGLAARPQPTDDSADQQREQNKS